MLIRWKNKDKGSSNPNNQISNISAKKKRKGREEEQERLPQNDQTDDRRRANRREDPRRHTLGGDMLNYVGNHISSQQRTVDLEMNARAQKSKKGQVARGYPPLNQGPLFDDDPGIMSEVETASTGFRRGGKQRSSLPVVRTPSKTLERPLGLVFLQYRSETKRALLPNEITSIDTVRALFVRSFPRQLTMAYLEGPNVKIYIHDASKDMFYELEDVRSHLREIRDRSVLRLFESTEVATPPHILPGGSGIPQPLPLAPQSWDQDQNYFSEPEFDSEYKTQHIHKTKLGKQAPYYVGASQTLPRGMFSAERNKIQLDGYTSSPERNSRGNYEEPYYSQYGTRGPPIAAIIDEEQSDLNSLEDQYGLYGMKLSTGRLQRASQIYDTSRPEELHRIRVEHMERQLANLTGLVQKALVSQNPQISQVSVSTLDPKYMVVETHVKDNAKDVDQYMREKAPKLGKNACQKSVSFEKSVSFSDDIQGLPKSHTPQFSADNKPTKPAIKSSTLPRTSSQERDRLKPTPPPKPVALTQTQPNYRPDIALAPEVYNHLRVLQKKAKDLRLEVRTLRRLSQAQSVAIREDIKGVFMRIRATLLASNGKFWNNEGDQEQIRITREEELYKQEVLRLEKDLSDLEASVETLRGEVINRRTRVNMTKVEDMALVLSRASKTVAELKLKFPALSNGIRCILTNEMEKVVREEKFLKEEPDRLESALRRCKKLTGTLVTLKRLASVQEQRFPPNENQAVETPRLSEVVSADKPTPAPKMGSFSSNGGPSQIPPENALDALLDELKTFSKPLSQIDENLSEDYTNDGNAGSIQSKITTQLSQGKLYIQNNKNNGTQVNQSNTMVSEDEIVLAQHFLNKNLNSSIHLNTNTGTLKRMNSYPSGSDTDVSPTPQHEQQRLLRKPPVPERTADLISKVSCKRVPPPPPPRTSSRSPLASPTNCNSYNFNKLNEKYSNEQVSIDFSGNEPTTETASRQMVLEIRHQELLKKQRVLQEQYQKLQLINKSSNSDLNNLPLLKTSSESNLQNKMVLHLPHTNKLSDIENDKKLIQDDQTQSLGNEPQQLFSNKTSNLKNTKIKQIYETEII